MGSLEAQLLLPVRAIRFKNIPVLCWTLLDQVLEEGLGGTIASVNFPENYEDNTDCSFTIVPVPGNHVTLQVNLVLIH